MTRYYKKHIYIFLFIILGLQLQYLTHVALEVWYLGLLIQDFPKYSLGLSWSEWFRLHQIFTWILIVSGLTIGAIEGNHWWHRIYGEGWRQPRKGWA